MKKKEKLSELETSFTLHSFVIQGDLDTVKYLLGTGYRINIQDLTGATALHCAAIYNKPEILDFLISKNADQNIQDKIGFTALHFAIIGENFGVAELLINSGAKYDIRDHRGSTALDLAQLFAHNPKLSDAEKISYQKIIDLILEKEPSDAEHAAHSDDASVEEALSALEASFALHSFVTYGNLDAVKSLLDTGYKINIQDSTGSTALYCAVFHNRSEILDFLINKNADLNIQNNYGFTALHFAVSEGNFGVAKLLVESGINCDIKSNQGSTAFDLTQKLAQDPKLSDAKKISNQKIIDLILEKEPSDAEHAAQSDTSSIKEALSALNLKEDLSDQNALDITVHHLGGNPQEDGSETDT